MGLGCYGLLAPSVLHSSLVQSSIRTMPCSHYCSSFFGEHCTLCDSCRTFSRVQVLCSATVHMALLAALSLDTEQRFFGVCWSAHWALCAQEERLHSWSAPVLLLCWSRPSVWHAIRVMQSGCQPFFSTGAAAARSIPFVCSVSGVSLLAG